MTTTNVGNKYGRWMVKEFSHHDKYRNDYWVCECECGEFKTVQGGHLRNGSSKSCGCLQKELAAKKKFIHGLSYHPLKPIYYTVLSRCHNPNNKEYNNYGGRGIKVCKRWRNSIKNFIEDMGERPDSQSIERIDNDGDYSPDNCKWATQSEQCRNNRNTRLITYKGKTQCLKDWSKELGIKYSTLSGRINQYGWSIENAFTHKIWHN